MFVRGIHVSPMQATFQGKKLGAFDSIMKNRECQKIITKVFTVQETVKLRILSSVATLEAHKI